MSLRPGGGSTDGQLGAGDGLAPGVALDLDTAAAALELLAHWWSRPLPAEVSTWQAAGELERAVRAAMNGEPSEARFGSLASESARLLDEYERLFVGPGPVSCPPYESFWREDVPVDIRRSLVGPCTATLQGLYGSLGLEVRPQVGELPDHVAVELEALSYAMGSDATLAVARVLFFEHLRPFLVRLCRAVAHEAEAAFYGDLAALTTDWLASIGRYLQSLDEPPPTTP